jgi:hypothetical protein
MGGTTQSLTDVLVSRRLRKGSLWCISAIALLVTACSGGSSEEEDANCSRARSLYAELVEKSKSPSDIDGDGAISVTEQVLYEGTDWAKELKEFRDDWYDVGGCSLSP